MDDAGRAASSPNADGHTAAAAGRSLLLMAVDGLDWPLMLKGVEAGWMPHTAHLLGEGAHGRLRMPPPTSPTAHWASVATGVMADAHGICHDWTPEADGLRLRRYRADDSQAEPVWQTAMRAGMPVRIAGWPATSGTTLPEAAHEGCAVVTEGFQNAEQGGDLCWPLAPDEVTPTAQRATVQEARMHPGDLDEAAWRSMLHTLPVGAQAALIEPARVLMARWASVHNLGTHWAAQGLTGLLMVRYDGLPGWMDALRRVGVDAEQGLQPWLAWLDGLLGRYVTLLPPGAHGMLISNEGRPPVAATALDELLGLRSPGGLLLWGPSVVKDSLLAQAGALDIAPTVRHLLDLSPAGAAADEAPGRSLIGERRSNNQPPRPLRIKRSEPSDLGRVWHRMHAAPADDPQAMAWLALHGVAPADTARPAMALQIVRAEQLAGWAAARMARGRLDDAAVALQEAAALAPDRIGLRLMWGECLMRAGRHADLGAWIQRLPAAARLGDWALVTEALQAWSEQNWTDAESQFLKLALQQTKTLDAALWLARVRLAGGDAAGTLAALELRLEPAQTANRSAEPHQLRAQAHALIGQHELAISAWTRALAAEPDNASLHLALGLALARAGQRDQAATRLWRALALDGQLHEARVALSQLTLDR